MIPRGRAVAAAAMAVAWLAAASRVTHPQLDSQFVLQRYSLAIEAAAAPKNVVFTYAVSQAGPSNIEQRHRIYRSGSEVRDETLAVDGLGLSRKEVRISRREDRYAVAHLAPRIGGAQVLFLHAVRDGAHLDYAYDITPLVSQSATYVDRITIDGVTFLPRTIHFHTVGAQGRGSGEIQYAPFGRYWMPVIASIDATVKGKPARERITWGDYRFPEGLPPSTFTAPRPLPISTP